MHTIVVPLEPCKGRPSKDEGRSKIDPHSVKLDMQDIESRKQSESATYQGSLKSCMKGKGLNDSESTDNGRKDIPPPYVIWVQFMGLAPGEQPPPADPLDYDPQSRNSFVQKVFLLIFIMLVICIFICLAINVVEPLRNMVASFALIIIIFASVILMILNYVIMCSPCGRQAPCSYVSLFLAAVCAGIICGAITMWQKTVIVYCAVGATVFIVIVCFLLAFSSFDFTKYMLYIVMISAAVSGVLLIYILLKMFMNIDIKPLHIGILLVAVIVEAIALAMELQLILGGKTVELGVDEYAAGAFMVFMSIFGIFTKLLQLAHLFDSY